MTWVRSQILRPDGSPVVGQCVTAVLIAPASWLSTGAGQASGKVRTNTDVTGTWRLDLLPYTAFEDSDAVYYEIHEGPGKPVWTIRVPPAGEPPIEYRMQVLLFDPPGSAQ